MSLLSEIKRRNVFRVALAYAAISWMIIQLVTTVEQPLSLPDFFDTLVIVFLAIGFPVALLLAWAFELTPEGIRPTESVEPEASTTRQTGQKLTQITIGVLAVAVLLLLADRFLPDEAFEPIANSIAVVPFESLSPREDDALLAMAVYTELIDLLSMVGEIRPIQATTMRSYADTSLTVQEIARELQVENVMLGELLHADGKADITVRLFDGRDGTPLWVNDYREQSFDDFFATRSDMAMNVANQLAVVYSTEEQQLIERQPTDSGEATALYAAAADLLRRGQPRNVAQSLARISEALDIDPAFVDAWILKANAHFTMSVYDDAEFHDSQRREAIRTALDLDPDNPRVMMARADYLIGAEKDAVGAYEAYLRAKDLSAQPLGSRLLLNLGYLEEAVAEAEQAVILDPLNSVIYGDLIMANDALGRDDEVRYWFERARSLGVLGPAAQADYFAFSLAYSGLDEDSVPDPPQDRFVREWLEPSEDREQFLNQIRARYDGQPTLIDLGWIAIFAAYLGDPELASRIFIAGDVVFTRAWTTINSGMRQQPDFRQALIDFGYVDVWKDRGWPDLCEPLGDDDFVCH